MPSLTSSFHFVVARAIIQESWNPWTYSRNSGEGVWLRAQDGRDYCEPHKTSRLSLSRSKGKASRRFLEETRLSPSGAFYPFLSRILISPARLVDDWQRWYGYSLAVGILLSAPSPGLIVFILRAWPRGVGMVLSYFPIPFPLT